MIIYYDPEQRVYLCKCGEALTDCTDLADVDEGVGAPDLDEVWAASEADVCGPGPRAHDVLLISAAGVISDQPGACAVANLSTVPPNDRDEWGRLLRYDTERAAFLCACGTPLQYMVDYPNHGESWTDADALWAASPEDALTAPGGEPQHDVLREDAGVIAWAARGACPPQG
jgi:hypothetical protein